MSVHAYPFSVIVKDTILRDGAAAIRFNSSKCSVSAARAAPIPAVTALSLFPSGLKPTDRVSRSYG